MKYKHIVINGGEGAGKGVQTEKIKEELKNYISVREPGGTKEAEIIREVLLNADYDDKKRVEEIEKVELMNVDLLTKKYLKKAKELIKEKGINGESEKYLYAASRNESNKKIVKKAKEDGKIVIADRSVACSMAYQGYARGVGMENVWKVNEPTLEGAMPEIEIFLEISVEEAEKRLKNRQDKYDRLDQESAEFHNKVREGYKIYYEKYCPYKVVFLNADDSIENVNKKIKEILGL